MQDTKSVTSFEIDDDDEKQIDENEVDCEDVMTISMMKLYYAQEAFKIELHKLKDVGKDDYESCNPSSNIIETETRLNQNITLDDMKAELDELMKQKMAVEVQYIAMSKASEHFKVQVELMVEEKKVMLEQMEMMKRLEDAEVKAVEVKTKAEKLQVTCEEILEKEEVWEARNMVSRLTSLFCVELMILFGLLVFVFFFGV
ncbi:uncharacterized protein LOC143568403 [Bidens hawaiensis]|uniref:uncharacterized protein LOC143568403 n=1 Tax=Bidens hawaiensis TaxID=980011 RepID=UPI004049ACB6